MGEITISYETLFELLRREKERNDLQKLEAEFLDNVFNYLKERSTLVKNTEDLDEQGKIIEQLSNVKKIIKELYDRRERKIISLAIDKSKHAEAVIDSALFLPQEMEFFNKITAILESNRDEVLNTLLSLKRKEVVQESSEEAPKEPKKEITLVRFMHAVPKFVGRELEEYGPFEENDIASLPTDIANVLISKKRAEAMEE